MRNWIQQGAPGPSETNVKIVELQVTEPGDAIVMESGQASSLLIEAVYLDGSRRDVTR